MRHQRNRTLFHDVGVGVMSFVRAKEIPPGSGNLYDYEVMGVRDGVHVRQKVLRYLGKHGTDHAMSLGGTATPNANLQALSAPVTRDSSLPDIDYKVTLHRRDTVKRGAPVVDATLTPFQSEVT
jgi:hypothetical protein